MKRKLIRLTESDLHKIVKESVKKLFEMNELYSEWYDEEDYNGQTGEEGMIRSYDIGTYYDSQAEEDAKEIQKFNKTLDLTIESKIRSPRVITIIRDEDGNILNSANLGRIGNYIDEISDYSSNDLKIKKVKIANEYNYRMMNVKYTDESGVVYYVQLLVNSDSEELLIQNYGKMISYAIALGILLSLLASILLSKITLKPLEESFEIQ